MKNTQTFTAIIQDPGGGGAFVEMPFDVESTFGSKRPKVKATIDGVPYRGTLTRMGTDCHILGIRKEIREQIGKSFGDEVAITVEPDTEPRVVDVPAALQQALESDKEANARFEKLSYTHQREYVEWINDAKREETRQNRIARTVDRLKNS